MLLAKVELNPNSLPVATGFSGSDDPANAPAPSGLTDERSNQSLIRSKSRANA